MKHVAFVLAATVAAACAQAQLSQPANGQVNTQQNTQRNTSLNGQLDTAIGSQVNTGAGGSVSPAGVGSARTPLGATPPAGPSLSSGTIGTPGVTAPLGTIDSRPPSIGNMSATGTTSITNTTSGASLSPGAVGASQPLNNGSWGPGSNPNNTLAPAPAGVTGGTPGLSPAGAPTGR
ncbi:hypothetical protein [Pseudoduganella chitinolytica]|uniref:Uncharacterized protein n=1 Tax=Pseudoduganella chitinolytica TaxID=34070 RepID=A0ABY8BEW2_9BURK|nr:hypothetical protein [Pseudoduganella chitinolytica]WEF34441.1 hypothetical protein PX653_06630 [Pseudoduganella chitinolytica]